ncbi:MAG TPA: hypothetical protein VGC30_03995, partial [Dokdonella sp.]
RTAPASAAPFAVDAGAAGAHVVRADAGRGLPSAGRKALVTAGRFVAAQSFRRVSSVRRNGFAGTAESTRGRAADRLLKAAPRAQIRLY